MRGTKGSCPTAGRTSHRRESGGGRRRRRRRRRRLQGSVRRRPLERGKGGGPGRRSSSCRGRSTQIASAKISSSLGNEKKEKCFLKKSHFFENRSPGGSWRDELFSFVCSCAQSDRATVFGQTHHSFISNLSPTESPTRLDRLQPPLRTRPRGARRHNRAPSHGNTRWCKRLRRRRTAGRGRARGGRRVGP